MDFVTLINVIIIFLELKIGYISNKETIFLNEFDNTIQKINLIYLFNNKISI